MQSERPDLLWINMLAGTHECEVPALVTRHADVRIVSDPDAIDAEIASLEPDGVVFDFDYPDRRHLETFNALKRAHPGTPMAIVTVHHSESLAVWAFRHGALDFLVKPFAAGDFEACMERLRNIMVQRRAQRQRTSLRGIITMPVDVPVTFQRKKNRLAPAVYYVSRHFSERIYVDAVARLCDMSPTHFSRSFHQTYHLTFQEFILRYRVAAACRMLRTPSASITDVALGVGFTDASYFAKVFRRFTGIMPSRFAAGEEAANDALPPSLDSGESTSASQVVRSLGGAARSV